MNNSQGTSRRRDRLRTFAQSTTLVIKQEINKYYHPSSSSSSISRGIMATPATATAATTATTTTTTATTNAAGTTEITTHTTTAAQATTTTTETDEPLNNGVKRSDTQEIDAIIQDSVPEVVQPQCMLFPTYASQVEDDSLKEVEWKVVLAGWTFSKPSDGRLNRWLLAAGRKYGGFKANSVEDTQFSTLFNQFRSQTMTMTEIQLTLPGIIANKIIENNSDILNTDQQEKIRDFAASVNSGTSGRFEKEILLDTESVKLLKEKSKYLTVEASFKQDAESPFPGFVDIIEPYGISIISDIDDTIKITDVPDGKDAIIQNTFFRAAREVPGMSEVYRNWASEGAHVHYVSNGPWQVYPALQEFFSAQQFPQGSMHLRNITASELIIGKPGSHKLEVIPKIFKDFPHRKFILVGDTGEIDPEIYQKIYEQFPDQVIKIFIHDVTSQRAMAADKKAQQESQSDSYYNNIRKFISRESTLLRRGSTSQLVAMEAMTSTEVPEEQENISDPDVPVLTKLEQFEARMKRVSAGMRDGVFTVYTLASQLLLDPVVAEEFLMTKPSASSST